MDGRNDIEFVPMVHKADSVWDIKTRLKPGFATHVLGFNEPDHEGQANIDPYYAAQLWKEHIQPLASQGYRLISPAPTNAQSGTQWLTTFMNACNDCSISAVAAHWYGMDPQNFIEHITDYHNRFGLNVWVTEFACQNFGPPELGQCSTDQIWALMKVATEFMDNTPWVEKYCWFGALTDMVNVNPENRLLQPWGEISDLGREYISW